MTNVYNSPWKFPIFCTKIWMLWYYYYYAKCILFILICGTHLDLSLWGPPLLSICLLFSSQINSDGKYKDKDKTNTKTKTDYCSQKFLFVFQHKFLYDWKPVPSGNFVFDRSVDYLLAISVHFTAGFRPKLQRIFDRRWSSWLSSSS